MSWIDDIMLATEEAESPRSFIYWSALAAISAAARRKVYLDKFLYKLYPNVFILLVAPAGARKGFPVSLCKALVKESKTTKVISGRNTIESIVKDLSRSETMPGTTAKLQKDAQALLVSEEFASFLVNDPAAVTILTDLYDNHDEWENRRKTAGSDHLYNICLTLLGASNETNLRVALPEEAYMGGFIRRCIIIKEVGPSRRNPLTEPPKNKLDIPLLATYLQDIAKLEGPFTWTYAGKKLFERWYTGFRPEQDPTGSTDTIHEQVLKVAMLVSLSERLTLTLEESDIKKALELCLNYVPNAESVSAGQGRSDLGRPTALVIQTLLAIPEHRLSRAALLRKCYGHFDAMELDRIVETLDQAGMLHRSRVGQTIYYALDKSVGERLASSAE